MDTQDPREHEQLQLEQSPFSQSAATGRFFSGGRRQEVLDGMVSALTGGIAIVTLTGDEGSGKTVLCRMLEDRINPDCPTVYFPQTADSFEDVLKAIVQRLELGTDQLPKDRAGLLQNIVSNLHDRNQRVLLIFDEAERIYLATLERVRKMLDLANHSGIFIQMVLSGRSGLHQNFKNLALCNFQPAEERHFTLEPLTDDETYAYLTFAMLDAVPAKRALFGRKAAVAIFASSRGNFRSITHRADELLRGYEGKDQLSPVADNGLEKQISQDKPRRRLKRPTAALPKFALNWRYVAWGGGAACIVLALFLFRPEEKTVGPQVEAVQDSETSIVISKPKEMERVEPNAETIGQNGPEKQEKEEASVVHNGETNPRERQPDPTPTPEVAEQAPYGTPASAKPVVVSSPQQPENPSAGTRLQAEEKQQTIGRQTIPASEIAETKKTASSDSIEPTIVAGPRQPETPLEPVFEVEEKQPLADSTVDIPEQEVEKEIKPSTPPIAVDTASQSGLTRQKVDVVPETNQTAAATEDRPMVPPMIKAREVFKHREVPADANRGTITNQRIKILKQEDEPDAFELPATPITIRAVEQKKESELAPRPAPPTELKPQAAESEKAAVLVSEKPKRTDSVDKIYTSRVAAGASWLSGIKDDRYTVRLMVITSGDAEKKLKTMLGEKNYREQANKLYILRRESNPGVQYVYYGEYPTMTAARNARNTIPEFLRGYKPYAMSVKGAVQRAQQEE